MIHKFSRYLLTLVALFAMTAGAWADETPLVTIESKDYKTFTSGSMTFDDKVTVTFSNEVNNIGNKFGWYAVSPASLTVAGTNGYTITSCKFYTDDGIAKTGYTVEGESPSVYLYNGYVFTDANQSVNIGSFGVTKIEVYGAAASSATAVEVTTNAASEGATFTEATFDMPTFDATVSYELVRDMAQSMTTQVGDGNDGFTIRVKKDGESFVPSEMTLQQMMALFNVHDGIENQDLVFYGDGKVCDISIFAVDDQDQPTGDAIAFAALTPGRYVAIATAADGSAYDGQTPASNIFELAEAYDLTLSPATNANLKSVTVGEGTEAQTATPDEKGVIKNIEPGKKVKITTTGPDYIIRKAAVKKGAEPTTLTITGALTATIYYIPGETWKQAIENHPTENTGWFINGYAVAYQDKKHTVYGADVNGPIDPNANYSMDYDPYND